MGNLTQTVCRAFICAVLVSGFPTAVLAQDSKDARAATVAEPRIALIIGNSKYASAPLPNPVNDANEMAKALSESGFKVIQRNNATQKEMTGLLRDFGDHLRRGGVGIFYYAGHGMQVKGRNYLIPVDAQIEREDEVAFNSIDANQVLEKMEAAKNRLNIVILDACRNNPFARGFRSASQGLAQMDAPVGTLIAFSTSPGSVASDGSGKNGLYTQHLLDNMKKPGMKLEDVFKNVRSSVRRDSNGKQVPWESTSLEGDFYFAPAKEMPGQNATATMQQASSPTLSDSAAFELAFWDAIKTSSNPEDYKAYLIEYPRGRFAALARARSSVRIAATQQPSASHLTPQTSTSTVATLPIKEDITPTQTQTTLRVDTTSSTLAPVSMQANVAGAGSATAVSAPNSVGNHDGSMPSFKVGDQWTYATYDEWKNEKTREDKVTIRAIENNTIIFDDGRKTDASGVNTLSDATGATYSPRQEFLDFPLFIGKQWSGTYEQVNANGNISRHQFRAQVIRREKVTVPAGTFDAIYIEQVDDFKNQINGLQWQGQIKLWYAPAVKRIIKLTYEDKDNRIRTQERIRRELISYKLN